MSGRVPVCLAVEDLKGDVAAHEPVYQAAKAEWTKARERKNKLDERRGKLSRRAVRALLDAGWDHTRVAKAIGVTPQRICQLLAGVSAFPLDSLETLAGLANPLEREQADPTREEAAA